MIKNSTINERILYIIENQYNNNQKKFAEAIGFAAQVIFNIVSGRKSKPSFDVIESIISTNDNINPEWLLTGKGSMIKNSYPENDSLEVVKEKQSSYKASEGIPLVTVTAIGGFSNSNFSIAERDVKAYYVIPKFQHKKIDFMIEVEGSSMYPKYNSGDVVACRIINEHGFIQWNKTHVIATKDQGIIIKRIKKNDESSLLMISDNKAYDPFVVGHDEIDGIALVVGVIRLE